MSQKHDVEESDRAEHDAELLRLFHECRAASTQDYCPFIVAIWEHLGLELGGTARNIMRNPAEAEDLVQNTMLKLIEKAPHYDPHRGSVRTWVHMILKYEIRKLFRAKNQKKHAEAPLPPNTENDEEPTISVFEKELQPWQVSQKGLAQKVMMKEELAGMVAAINQLDSPWPEVWKLILLGYERDEIALQLGINKERLNEFTSKRRLLEKLKRLRICS